MHILLRCSLAVRVVDQEMDDAQVKLKEFGVGAVGGLATIILEGDQHDSAYMTPSEEFVWWSDRWKAPWKIQEDTYRSRGVINQTKKWCHDCDLPPANRAPAKVQGMYYLKGLGAADPIACFSNGMCTQVEGC